MRDFFFLLSFAFICLMGCSQLQNQSDRIGVECSVKKNLVSNANYIKLAAPNGSFYQTSDVQALQAILKTSANDRQNLPITPNACIIVQDEGTVQAIDARNGDSISIPIKRSESPVLQILHLSTKQPLQVSLACSGDGLFASKSLPQPLAVNYSGDVTGLELRLDAFNVDNTFAKTLYSKTVAETELKLSESLSVSELAEGSYFLKIYGTHISDGMDNRFRLLNPDQSCRLTVLRGQVMIQGLDSQRLVYPSDAKLPWASESPYESLSYCAEEHISTQLETAVVNECQPKNYCLDRNHYKKVSVVKTDKTGIYDYYVFGENRIGTLSALACQTLVVSNDAPQISVGWQHDDLKIEGAVLRKPYAVLKAGIEVNHKLLSKAQIKQNLMCKVEFEIKGKSAFSDSGVICLEGRCKGRSLAEFQPCDENLSFTLINSLDQSALFASRLLLKIKAEDGAGHTAESQASLWINQTTWTRDTLDFIVDRVVQDLITFEIDPSGTPIAVFSEGEKRKSVAVFKDGEWKVLLQDTSKLYNYKLVKAPDQSIRVIRIASYVAGYEIQINSYENGQLVEVVPPKPNNYIKSCDRFLIGPANDYWCMGFTLSQAYHLKDGEFQPLPLPVPSTDIAFEQNFNWRMLQDGSVVAYSGSNIFNWKSENWTRQTLSLLPSANHAFGYDLIEDFKGRLWMYVSSTLEKSSIGLYRIEGSALIKYPAPVPERLSPVLSYPTTGPGLTSVVSGPQRFDFSLDRWVSIGFPLDLASSVLPDTISASNNSSGTALSNLGAQGILEFGPDLLYWPTKGLGYQTNGNGLGSIRAGDKLYFLDSSRRIPTLVRIVGYPTAFFDSRILNIRESAPNGSWIDAQGNTVISLTSGSTITSTGGKVSVKKSSAQLDGAGGITKLSERLYWVLKFSGMYIYDDSQDSLTKISDDGLGKAAVCSLDTMNRLWWLQNESLYIWNGKEISQLESNLILQEKISAFKGNFANDHRIASSDKHIFIFNDQDLSQVKTIGLGDFFADSTDWKIEFFNVSGDHQLLIQLKSAQGQRAYFSLDEVTGEIVEDKQLKSLIGNSGSYQIRLVGNTLYMVTPNFQASILKKTQQGWEVIAKLDDFRTIIGSKDIPPAWILPEATGRIWIMTRSPMALGRFDP